MRHAPDAPQVALILEQIASLRAMPNMIVLRPTDANETVEAWRIALTHTGGPVGVGAHAAETPGA
jgi:transketolase